MLSRLRRNLIGEDDIWEIYATSFGEWGGSVFFKEKSTGRVYSPPNSIHADQVFIHNGAYIIVENLAHMNGYSGMIEIKDPHDLCLIPDSLSDNINWYRTATGNRIVREQANAKALKQYGIKYLFRFPGQRIFCPLAFSRGTYLYCILSKDSGLVLTRVDTDRLYPIRTIRSCGVGYFSNRTVSTSENETISVYGSSSEFGDSVTTTYRSSSAILLAKGDSILLGERLWQNRSKH